MNLYKEELFSKWKNSSYGNDEITTSIAYNYDEYLSDPEIQLWFMNKEEEKSRQEDLAEGTIHIFFSDTKPYKRIFKRRKFNLWVYDLGNEQR